MGYGASAISQLANYNLYNDGTKAYVQKLFVEKRLPHQTFKAMPCPERGIVSFPYRGQLDKRRVPWDLIPTETWVALHELELAGLIINHPEEYVLSKAGWLFYVNVMYYLMPTRAKESMSDRIAFQHRKGRRFEDSTLEGLADLDGWLDM
jgi:oxygen-independent coproporphyrinogen-3 oxidase